MSVLAHPFTAALTRDLYVKAYALAGLRETSVAELIRQLIAEEAARVPRAAFCTARDKVLLFACDECASLHCHCDTRTGKP